MSTCTSKVESPSIFKNYSVYKIKNLDNGRYVSNNNSGVYVPDVTCLSRKNSMHCLPVAATVNSIGNTVPTVNYWQPYISYGDLVKGRGNVLLSKHDVANFFSRLIGLHIRSTEIKDLLNSPEEEFSDLQISKINQVYSKCIEHYDSVSRFVIEEIDLSTSIPSIRTFGIGGAPQQIKDDVRRIVRYDSCRMYSSYTLNTARIIYEKYKNKTLPVAYTSCYSKSEKEMTEFLVSAGITSFKYERDSYSFVLFNSNDYNLYKILINAANTYEESIFLTDLYPEIIRTEQLAADAIGDLLD